MGYLIDRQQAFRDTELVAITALRRRGVRSRVFLRDGSLYHTLTRPRTFRQPFEASHGKRIGQI